MVLRLILVSFVAGLGVTPPAGGEVPAPASKPASQATTEAVPAWALCPSCGQGRMSWVEYVPRPRPVVPKGGDREAPRAVAAPDSS